MDKLRVLRPFFAFGYRLSYVHRR